LFMGLAIAGMHYTAMSAAMFLPLPALGVEIPPLPRDLLALPVPVAQGDCDDYSMLAASMLLAEGIPCAFVTVAADSRDPSQFSHVYVVSRRGGARIPIDASHGPSVGWETPEFYRRSEWPVAQPLVVDIDPEKLRLPLLLGLAAALVLLWGGKKDGEEGL